jgi:hypothetical protein
VFWIDKKIRQKINGLKYELRLVHIFILYYLTANYNFN